MEKTLSFLVSFMLLLFAVQVNAEVVWKAHCRDRAPRIVVEPGGCSGPGADVITRAVQRLGHKVRWLTVPWVRTITVAEKGLVDVIPLHSMNKERELFLDPILLGYTERVLSFYTLASKPATVKQFDDLRALKIGAIRGSFYTEKFNQQLDELNVTYVTDTEQMLRMLEAGRFDVAVTTKLHSLEEYQSNSALTPVAFRDLELNGRYLSVPRLSANHQYVKALRKVVNDMRQSGEVTEIFEGYGVEAPVQRDTL